MKTDVFAKIRSLSQLELLAEDYRAAGKVIVHCHGCFDIVHPGHLRYLQFARQQGDVLVVSLTGDNAIEKSDGTRPFVPQEFRAESLAALEFVDHVVIEDGPTAEPVIAALRPDVYIKGKEYEESHHPGFLSEKILVEQCGGRVIFSSGDVVFSSTTIVQELGDALAADGFDNAAKLGVCCARWGIDHAFLRRTIGEHFRGKRVAVVGDSILDIYTFCETGNIAGEAPIMTVRPIEEKRYLGGAAIVAAHLKSMGAEPHLFTTTGDDAESRDFIRRLDQLGITHTALRTRRDLPTKLRYLAESQKLLKVDRGCAQPLDSTSEKQLIGEVSTIASDLDAAIFLDFGYGTVTASLLSQLLPAIRPKVRIITGDVSGPRRTLLAMHGADLITPNERELRSVVGDFDRSLPTVVMELMKELRAANLAVTMGARGCVLFRPREENRSAWFTSRLRSEYLPTLAPHAIDPLGAGDAFLSAATLSLSCGATLTQAGYIGSAAAAVAVGRIGNQPVSTADLLAFLRQRPELARAAQANAG